MTTETLLAIPEAIATGPVLKRKEEQYKFIFNWGFDHLKTRLAENLRTYSSPCESQEDLFCDYYFGSSTFDKEHFKKYFNNASDDNKKHKIKYNAQFIAQLRESNSFITDLINSIDQNLTPFQSLVVDDKLRAIFDRWEGQFQKQGRTERVFHKICLTIQSSRKFKCPWTFQETRVAAETIKQVFASSQNRS